MFFYFCSHFLSVRNFKMCSKISKDPSQFQIFFTDLEKKTCIKKSSWISKNIRGFNFVLEFGKCLCLQKNMLVFLKFVNKFKQWL